MSAKPTDVAQFIRSFDLSFPESGITPDMILRRLFEVAYGQYDAEPVMRGGLDIATIRKDGVTADQVVAELRAQGYRPLWFDDEGDGSHDYLFVSPERGMLRMVERNDDEGCRTTWYWTCLLTERAKLEELIRKFHDEYEIPKRTFSPLLYALVLDGMDLEVVEVGRVGMPFRRQNYEPQVCESYDRVVQELQAADPPGRLVLIDGPPGVGKTYLIRSLVQDCRRCKFVVVMPDSLIKLSEPAFLPALMRECRRSSRKLVLVVEDGDSLVRAREADSESAALNHVAALLTMSDGLLGHALDLRVIATTNQESVALDKAVTRDGRMLARIPIAELSVPTATKCLQSLVPGAELGDDASSRDMAGVPIPPALSEVYAIARAHGWRPEGAEKGSDLVDDEEFD
jgi:hypothetical protein